GSVTGARPTWTTSLACARPATTWATSTSSMSRTAETAAAPSAVASASPWLTSDVSTAHVFADTCVGYDVWASGRRPSPTPSSPPGPVDPVNPVIRGTEQITRPTAAGPGCPPAASTTLPRACIGGHRGRPCAPDGYAPIASF